VPDALLDRLTALRAGDLPTHGGRTLAYVYDSGLADADEVGRRALAMFASTNGLDPTAFPSLAAMERDLVATARPLLGAPDTAVGTATSGGTESILLAVQTARDAAGVPDPVLVVPSTAHGAFHKAAHYFGLRLVAVDVDPVTKRAVPDAMAAAMDAHAGHVALVAVSAPSYAHGVIDPVAPVAAAAAERGLRCHVDACIGGWVLPWAEPAPEPWDFRCPGVTSVSVDLHKYAYTPKGVSLLLHRTPELRKAQFFATADWPGYTMLNSTTQSTKSGGPLAAAWAVVQHIGLDGYRDLVATTLTATRRLADGIAAREHLSLAAPPDSSLVAVQTDPAVDAALDVFTLSDEMGERGWFVQPQMAFRDLPATLHLTVCAATAAGVDDFLAALDESVTAAVAAGPVAVDPSLREAAAALDPATLDDAAFDGLLELAGLGGGGTVTVPERMAPVNALLDAAPPRLREALLVAFLDRLTR
jgi:sphinganine-1-phosphate aldolase